MEVLNAAGLTPICLHKTKTELRKISLLPSINLPKFSKSPDVVGGLTILSSVLHGREVAKALTYEEALGQSMSTSTSVESSDFDLGGLVDSIVKFGTENPAVLAGVCILALPLILSQITKKRKPWGVESAEGAYVKLSEEAEAQLLDIRPVKEIRNVGSPDVRGLKKKVVAIEYKGEQKPRFLDKLASKFKDPGNTTLFVLDKFGGNSKLVAELAAVNGFKAAFAIKDGAEGPRGWMNSGLPWLEPKKLPGLDFGDIKEVFDGFGEGTDAQPVTLGLAAATALGVLAFTEIENVLQLLGSVALVQFATKKLLFAEDRKQTLKQVDEFLKTKVAPADLLDDIKMIGKALLPPVKEQPLLPAGAEASTSTSTSDSVPTVNAEPKLEASTEIPQINSFPKTEVKAVVDSTLKAEVKAEVAPGSQRPLSPYPCYPDFRPPTSPSPSQP